MNISRSFNKSRYESFHKTLLYKHIILRGFCSRYLLVFTAWQLLCHLLKLAPEFPIEIPLLSCVQSLGLQRTITPFFLTSVEQGSQITQTLSLSLSGCLNLECKGQEGKYIGAD